MKSSDWVSIFVLSYVTGEGYVYAYVFLDFWSSVTSFKPPPWSSFSTALGGIPAWSWVHGSFLFLARGGWNKRSAAMDRFRAAPIALWQSLVRVNRWPRFSRIARRTRHCLIFVIKCMVGDGQRPNPLQCSAGVYGHRWMPMWLSLTIFYIYHRVHKYLVMHRWA